MICIERVSRSWLDFAIKDVSLKIREGEYIAIVGPTGAGKTLLLELLLGIHQPDAGRILIGGRDVTLLPPERRGIGMVYQDYVLFPHLDVERNLAFGLKYTGHHRARHHKQSSRKINDVASSLGIAHLLHRYPATLSGGEKQRVAIGRALVTESRVLLLDEPFSALDVHTASRLREELKSLHQARGLTILHVTHDLAEARRIGGSIALIHEGELNAFGLAEELTRHPPNLFAAKFFGAVNLYQASIEQRQGENWARVGPICVPLGSGNSTRPWIMVRPDEVVLLDPKVNGCNVVHGEIVRLLDEGHYTSVQIRVEGLPGLLTAETSRQWLRAHEIEFGSDVAADVSRGVHTL